MKNQNKTKVGVGSVVNTKVGELEKITREGGSISMRKYVMVCVQDVLGKNNFLVQLEDGHKKYISYSLIVFLNSKEEVEMEEALYHYT